MDWGVEAAAAVQAFDEALGRPPFPQEPSTDLTMKATAVLQTISNVVDAGKLRTLESVEEVTTTLPILCASLREGSPDRRPSLSLYRPLLLSVGLASSLSTYPISHIVSDAKSILGTSLYEGGAGGSANATGTTVGSRENANTDENEVALFQFMSATRSLTPDDMRRLLRLPLTDSTALQGKVHSKTKAPKKGGAPSAKASTNTVSSSPSGEVADQSAVPTVVLNAMIDAPLSDDCRRVFESFMDNTQKFLDVVGGDGDLASRILAVYGARIVPKLKLSSLLPCLNAALLDYYVDIVACSQTAGTGTLLKSKELREIPLTMWDVGRVRELAYATVSRTVRPDEAEATASLTVYTFLYMVFCDIDHRHEAETTHAAALSTVEKLAIEEMFMHAMCRALQAVLMAGNSSSNNNNKSKKTTTGSSPTHVYVQSTSAILMVYGTGVPTWLEVLSHFVVRFLSRQAAAEAVSPSMAAARTSVANEREVSFLTVPEVADTLEDTLGTFLDELTSTPPKAEQRASTVKPQSTNKNAAARGNGKQKGGGAGEKSTNAVSSQTNTREAELTPPVVFSELLSWCCDVFTFTSLLRRCASLSALGKNRRGTLQRGGADKLAQAFHAYSYLLQYQPQRLNAALWQSGLSLFTLSLWFQRSNRSREFAKDDMHAVKEASTFSLTLNDQQLSVLRAATASTDCMLWLSPLVLPSDTISSEAQRAAVASMFCSDVELWMTVVQAAVSAQSSNDSVASPLCRQLFPASASYVLGSLCSLVDADVLQTFAEAIVTAAASRSTVMIATLTRMHSVNWADLPAIPSSFADACVPATVPADGLRRLLDLVAILHAGHLAVERAAEAGAKVAAQQAMQAQLQQAHQLAAAHRDFVAEMAAKRAIKAAEQQKVQEEVSRRRAEAAARFREHNAARARKRQNALETLREKASQTQADREALRRKRFTAYQQRVQSEYRVTTFLEHLNLSSARVMETRNALSKVVDSITPDDLLEFLVSGNAKVPLDMITDEVEEDAVEASASTERMREQTVASLGARETPLRYSGDRRDFWSEIMDHAEAVETATPASTPKPAPPAAPPAPAHQTQSFHKRVSPLLDLFFYEDGDEYGNVPAVLPSIRLRLAASMWPPAKTQDLGFANLREAFTRMQQRGLVQIRNGTVQLTLLGFRYHFPFHDPDGMLEVFVREARERVRAAVLHQSTQSVHDVEDDEESEEDEEDEEEGDEDEEDHGRLLPDVEFGI